MENEFMVKYKCQACGADFDAIQGSRQRYCPSCLVERVKSPKYQQGKCELCGKEGSVVKHHNTYDMFGKKKVPKGKLIIVCLSCHSKIHWQYPRKKKGERKS